MEKILFLFLFPFHSIFAQNYEPKLLGLWDVVQVKIGSEEKTPIAKWVEFKPDHTQCSGNGWVQYSLYIWQFDNALSSLSLQTIHGIQDPDGPFKVEFGKDSMTWVRKENSKDVIVSLKKTDHLPAAYSDKMIGLWKVIGIETNETNDANVFIFGKNTVLFLRADRRYSIQYEAGKSDGVWHAHAHRKRVRLLSDEGDAADMNWEISFEKEKMVWENSGGKLPKVVFERVYRF